MWRWPWSISSYLSRITTHTSSLISQHRRSRKWVLHQALEKFFHLGQDRQLRSMTKFWPSTWKSLPGSSWGQSLRTLQTSHSTRDSAINWDRSSVATTRTLWETVLKHTLLLLATRCSLRWDQVLWGWLTLTVGFKARILYRSLALRQLTWAVHLAKPIHLSLDNNRTSSSHKAAKGLLEARLILLTVVANKSHNANLELLHHLSNLAVCMIIRQIRLTE